MLAGCDSYRSTLLLGCSECYKSFEKLLLHDLRKFHGNVEHKGRVPEDVPATIERRRNPQEIRKRLADAVKAEDFELAARLRDELRGVGLSVLDPGELSRADLEWLRPVFMERVFPVHTPRIAKIEVVNRGKVRRAKLHYLRKRVGKRALLVKPA